MPESQFDRVSSKLMELWNQGFSKEAIARQVQLSGTTVGKYLRQLGIDGYNYSWLKELTEHQRNVLWGTVLGDGCLTYNKGSQNAFLKMGHGLPQKSYLEWKAQQLVPLFNQTIAEPYVKRDGHTAFHLSSRSHPILSDVYSKIYTRPDIEMTDHVGKKRITEELLSKINDQMLAIWWCDDGVGCYQRRARNLGFCFGGLTQSEYLLCEDWLAQQGFPPAKSYPGTNVNSDGSLDNSYEIVWNYEISAAFRQCILPWVPKCMYPKLGITAELVS